ncbi:hypothetical protein [Lysinibacillus fusiformis]|uniref:hypothetical protein n=1 Tax=Lysinibacillus fusiformis TaxID=28031 RepID=UPI00215A2A4B|nr:hypothetical protein [Lysinibacillus fusiformis]MCR8852541.1 hypothetical protein [Lysinibacillus fusiformis]WKT79013.1 hypothetical protein QYY55_09480 [Lysinibacillus fusiformis]
MYSKKYPKIMVTMLTRSLNKVDNNSYSGAKTTIYGIEATLPKASCGTSDLFI